MLVLALVDIQRSPNADKRSCAEMQRSGLAARPGQEFSLSRAFCGTRTTLTFVLFGACHLFVRSEARSGVFYMDSEWNSEWTNLGMSGRPAMSALLKSLRLQCYAICIQFPHVFQRGGPFHKI